MFTYSFQTKKDKLTNDKNNVINNYKRLKWVIRDKCLFAQ